LIVFTVKSFLKSRFTNCLFRVLENKNKKGEQVGVSVSLGDTVDYKWVTVMNGVKFEINDEISLYTKNDSERRVGL